MSEVASQQIINSINYSGVCMKNDSSVVAYFGIATMLFAIMFNIAIAWVIASSLTSVFKSAKNDCDKVYNIESVLLLNGDFFCE